MAFIASSKSLRRLEKKSKRTKSKAAQLKEKEVRRTENPLLLNSREERRLRRQTSYESRPFIMPHIAIIHVRLGPLRFARSSSELVVSAQQQSRSKRCPKLVSPKIRTQSMTCRPRKQVSLSTGKVALGALLQVGPVRQITHVSCVKFGGSN